MTNLTPSSVFDEVYKLLSTDSVDARNADPMDPQGIANRQAQQLLNRTKWLYDNLPVNKDTVINFTGAINTDFDAYQDTGYYTVTSSGNYEGSLLVFNNPDISDYSCIQIVFLTVLSTSDSACLTRVLLDTTWSVWRGMDDKALNGYPVSLGTLDGGDAGKVLTFDGTKFGVAETSLPTHAIIDHTDLGTLGGGDSGKVLTWDGTKFEVAETSLPTHTIADHTGITGTHLASAGNFLRYNNDLNLTPSFFKFFDISTNALRESTFSVPSGANSVSPPDDGTEICSIDQDYDLFPMLMFDIRSTPDGTNYRYSSHWLSSSAITASDAGSTPANVAAPMWQHGVASLWVTKTANKKQLRVWSEGMDILIRSIKGS